MCVLVSGTAVNAASVEKLMVLVYPLSDDMLLSSYEYNDNFTGWLLLETHIHCAVKIKLRPSVILYK